MAFLFSQVAGFSQTVADKFGGLALNPARLAIELLELIGLLMLRASRNRASCAWVHTVRPADLLRTQRANNGQVSQSDRAKIDSRRGKRTGSRAVGIDE